MRSPIQWFVDWIDERLERKHWLRNQARAWQRCPSPTKQERVTEGNTLVDLYDTCPIERIVNASVRVSVPPRAPVTNVLPPGQRDRDRGRNLIITRELQVERLLRPGNRPRDAYKHIMEWEKMIHGEK